MARSLGRCYRLVLGTVTYLLNTLSLREQKVCQFMYNLVNSFKLLVLSIREGVFTKGERALDLKKIPTMGTSQLEEPYGVQQFSVWLVIATPTLTLSLLWSLSKSLPLII